MCKYVRVESTCPRSGRPIYEYEREDCLSYDCKDSWFYQPRQSTSHPSRFHEHINETPSLTFLDLPGPSHSTLVASSSATDTADLPQRRPRKLQKRARRRPVPEPEPEPDPDPEPAEGVSQESLLDSQAGAAVPEEEAETTTVKDKGKDKAKTTDDEHGDKEASSSPIKAVLRLPKVGLEVMVGLVTGLMSKIHTPRPRLSPLMRRLPPLPPLPPMPSIETLREVGVAVGNWTGVGYLWRGLSGLTKREPLKPFSFFSSPFKFKRP